MRYPIRFAIACGVVLALATPGTAAPRGEGLLPNLARQPVFHRSQSSGVEIGHLRIPAIDVDETVRSGVAMSVIDRGVAHWAGTALPGMEGNVVLAGHRTVKTHPFTDIDRLAFGDLVYMTNGEGHEVMYRVTDSYIVDPDALWITYDREKPTLTMFACHPKGSSQLRIVVEAELVTGRPIA